ncbi:hypothetical protein JTY81_10340 [Citrobacter freundii]|uniref:Fimbrial protein n=1 Tax=Citrobacter freundii TaxID=546 RepID=A0AAN4EZV7_CITFR|nr:hypothetical protein [Citrobacter freundii]MBM7251166.1 hypothetical protein [Citrobacter freundii]MBM7289303.1 hypothetical protein [Citrobacter freundii]
MSRFTENVKWFIKSGFFGAALIMSGAASANICSGTTADAPGSLPSIETGNLWAANQTPRSGATDFRLFVTLPLINHLSYYQNGKYVRTEDPNQFSNIFIRYDLQGYNQNNEIVTGTSGGSVSFNTFGNSPTQLNYFDMNNKKLQKIEVRDRGIASIHPSNNPWMCKFTPGTHDMILEFNFYTNIVRTQFDGLDLTGNISISPTEWRFPFTITQKSLLNISTISQVDFGKVFLGEWAVRKIEIKMTSNVVNKRVMFTYTASGLTKDDVLTINDRALPYTEDRYTSLTQWDEVKFSRDIKLQRSGNVTGKLNAQLHINAQFN